MHVIYYSIICELIFISYANKLNYLKGIKAQAFYPQ